jgi:hypothetical protein
MPGPRNNKAKRKVSIRKEKARIARKVSATSTASSSSAESVEPLSNSDDSITDTPLLFAPQPRIASPSNACGSFLSIDEYHSQHLDSQFRKVTLNEPPPLPRPCIHDPGNGPRVKDLMGFLKSPISSQPSWNVIDCMEYHHQEVIDFLLTLLPFEQAVVSRGVT